MPLRATLVLALVSLTACTSSRPSDQSAIHRSDTASPAGSYRISQRSEDVPAITAERAIEVDRALAEVMARHQINTAGVAVIKGGDVAWSNHYGEQAPGVPASERTLYDVGSITKTVVAETVLRLAADGRLSLDEPMSAFWVDPDLADDPRHAQLTPRMALTHTTGFMNWRFFADDRKLAFVHEPGTTFGYSGEGFMYLARFVEAKLGEPFDRLVERYVFEPAGVRDASMRVDTTLFSRIARSLDADGRFPGPYCRPEGWCREPGDFSAAGGMVIRLGDLARLMTASMRGEGLTPDLVAARNALHSEQDAIDCGGVPEALCPTRVGYGLGWNVTEAEGARTLGHRGSDWSVVSLAYTHEGSGDGLVVLLNAPNQAGIAAMVDVLRLLDPDSPELHGYVARRDRASE